MTDLTKLSDDELINTIFMVKHAYDNKRHHIDYKTMSNCGEECTQEVQQELKARLARLRELQELINDERFLKRRLSVLNSFYTLRKHHARPE